jgi:2-dehydro-3-deoxygalactonokinase
LDRRRTRQIHAASLGNAGRHTPIAHKIDDRSSTEISGLSEQDLLRLVELWLSDRPTLTLVCGRTGLKGQPVQAAPAALRPVSLPISDHRVDAFSLPGLTQPNPPDMMDADATRIAGFLALNSGWDGVICQPGPHTSWAHISAGEVISFQTFLTVDLAKMLTQRFSLSNVPTQSDWNTDVFARALDDALSRPERLATMLNITRIGALEQSLPDDLIQSRLWGSLVGAELAAARPYWLGQQIAVIGPGEVTRPYCKALQRQGAPVTVAYPDVMTLAGLAVARSHIQTQN